MFGKMDIVIFRGNIKHKYSLSHAASGCSDPLHPFWYAQRLYQVITLYCDLLSNSTSQSTNNVQNEYKYRAIFFTPEDLLDRFSRNAQATNQGLKLRALRARQNTAQLVKILSDTTQQNV